jgi:hypothetical protein
MSFFLVIFGVSVLLEVLSVKLPIVPAPSYYLTEMWNFADWLWIKAGFYGATFIQFIVNTFSNFIEFIRYYFDLFADFFVNFWNYVTDFFSHLFTYFVDFVTEIWNFFANLLPELIKMLDNLFGDILAALYRLGKPIVGIITSPFHFKDGWCSYIYEYVSDLLDRDRMTLCLIVGGFVAFIFVMYLINKFFGNTSPPSHRQPKRGSVTPPRAHEKKEVKKYRANF